MPKSIITLKSMAELGMLGGIESQQVQELSVVNANELTILSTPNFSRLTATKPYTQVLEEYTVVMSAFEPIAKMPVDSQRAKDDKDTRVQDFLKRQSEKIPSLDDEQWKETAGMVLLSWQTSMITRLRSHALTSRALHGLLSSSIDILKKNSQFSLNSIEQVYKAQQDLLRATWVPSQKTLDAVERYGNALQARIPAGARFRIDQIGASIALSGKGSSKIHATTLGAWSGFSKQVEDFIMGDAEVLIQEALEGKTHIQRKIGSLGGKDPAHVLVLRC